MPATLSETGCIGVEGVVPYTLQSPLWSDGAEKHRYVALPDEGVISVGADGDFELPVGSVTVKEFVLDGVKIETRFLMRGEKAWKAYTYLWRDDQSEADLVPDSVSGTFVTVRGQQWYVPSRNECFTCHTQAAGVSLGLELMQLQKEHTYVDVTAQQIATLQHIGFLPEALPDVTALASPTDDAASLEERTRAYLHANCSFCHRPGSTIGSLDLRASVPFFATGTCNAVPDKPVAGAEGLLRIAPGHPDESLLVRLIAATDGKRMPPIGSRVPNRDAIDTISRFIEGLTDCPTE